MVNLELYRIFIIVANEENLSKASQKLNISQPAVTKHIKNLENELQVNLFKRSRYGMELTEKGQLLYNEIKDSVNILINVEKTFEKVRNINLGTHNTILSKMFSNCLVEYYKKHKKSKVNVLNYNTDIMLSKLINHELDIVLTKKVEDLYDNKKIKFISLGYLHDILVVNNNSQLLNKIITIEDLTKEILYTPRKNSKTTQNLMKILKLPYDVEVDYIKNVTYATMLDIIKKGEGIGIVTREYIQEELRENKISMLKTDFEIEKLEYGLYINIDDRFCELNDLIKIIKEISMNASYNF